MTAIQPVVSSFSGNWDHIIESPIVGKDVLELLSSSMYVNPLSIFREYVQNATDSIEEALALDLLNDREIGRVDIRVDPEKRTVQIRDNGTGLSRSVFTTTLIALGASRKRGTKARGFRGVGRLAGLGYCQELVFRSRSAGEQEINEMRWDCRRLKSILRDPHFREDVEDLIKEVVSVQRTAGDDTSLHFFEVELSGIVRHGDDRLMNAQVIRDYLSQVAPVPFSPEFNYGTQIKSAMRSKVNVGGVLIYLDGNREPLFRPHNNEFQVRRGVLDRFSGVRFFDISGADNTIAASGWILDHGYLGAIDNTASIKGLRLRSGNMQVGESDVLDYLFNEPRFNSWAVGEIHVLDDRILPNGRRDHFEQSTHFNNVLSQLTPIAQDLSRRCRQSSIRRNTIRHFDMAFARVTNNVSIVRQGVLGARERQRLQKETSAELKEMEKSCSGSSLNSADRARLLASLRNIRRRWEKVLGADRHNGTLNRLRGRERSILERLFTLVYECSPNRQSAKLLIDRILARI
jgi:molecular chaperone HtpG